LSSPKGDLLLSLSSFLPHQRIVISTEAAHAFVSGAAEKPTHLQLLLLLSLRVLLVVIPEGALHLRLRDKLPRMGRLLQSRTPAQLLWIIAASNALVVIGFGVLSLPSWRH
jgi:hypothetical protein